MTGLWLGFLGLAIISLTVFDVLSTTLTISGGGGPLTARVATWLWNLVLRQHDNCKGDRQASHRRLTKLGYAIALSPIVIWLGLMWMGWTLIFSSTAEAIVDAETKVPADVWTRIYFTGYTLFTLGLGDYKPLGAFWQIVTAVAALNGFFLVTFSISYLIPVVSAATAEQQLASYISTLGKGSTEIIVKAWNGKDFGLLAQHFIALTPMLTLHAQLYPAYPVVRFFHSPRRSYASAPSIAALDEALTLLEFGVRPECRPDAVALYALRQAISELIETLRFTFVQPGKQVPPYPSLHQLRQYGIPTVSDQAFELAVQDLAKRRKLLLALVRNDGWCWDDVITTDARPYVLNLKVSSQGR